MIQRPALPILFTATFLSLVSAKARADVAPTTTPTPKPGTIAAPAAPSPAAPTAKSPTAPNAPAPPAPALPPLPPPRTFEALSADIVKALGGADALTRHTALHTKMDIAFKGLGMTGTAEHFAVAGDKALTTTTLPGLATTREGCDGKQCWSEDPINGLRILAASEAEQARLETAWNSELRLKELFPKIEVKNERDDNGAVLECLILTPKEGHPWTDCFDAKTHLMTLQRLTHAGPQGDVPFVSRIGDWRALADIKVPYTTEMQAGPLSFSGTLTFVELDVAVDAKRFAPPVPAAKGPAGKKAANKKDASGKPAAAKPAATKPAVTKPASEGSTSPKH